jgi:hypothetical protein
MNNAGFVGIGTNNPGTNQLSVVTQSSSGSAGLFENNIAGGIDGSALRVLNSGTRTVGNNGMLIQNLVTKVGGNNSTKIGLKIESTGAWGVATVNQPNVGLDVNVSGADNNYAAIFNGGNVGIGIANPTTALYVSRNEGNGPVATFRNTYPGGGVAPQGIRIELDDNDLAANRLISFIKQGAEIGSVQGNNGFVTYATTSDRRLKTNIDDFGGALEMVNNLRPRQYAYKVNPERMEYGFIAQELQLILPQIVSGSEEGDVNTNPMMVDYSRLTPILTKAIQEQQKIIDSQKAEIDELKASRAIQNSADLQTKNQLESLQSQIDRLNTILTSEAKK